MCSTRSLPLLDPTAASPHDDAALSPYTQLSGAQLAQLLGGARLLEWDRAPEPQLSEGACG